MNSLINDRLDAIYEENLLVSDSQWRYTALKNSVLDQLKPRDFIEQMWAAEIIQGEWETLQLRRFKSSIITSARRPALQNLLHLLLQALRPRRSQGPDAQPEAVGLSEVYGSAAAVRCTDFGRRTPDEGRRGGDRPEH